MVPAWRVAAARSHPLTLQAGVPPNPRNTTKSTNLEWKFASTETPNRGSLSIYSTDLYRGVIIPIFGNEPIGRIVRAGGAGVPRS